MEEPDRIEIFSTILAPWKPGRLLDLGAGHGKFSIAAQGLGWRVTAVDARTERMPDTPGIEWIHSDVRSFNDGRPLDDWDCVAILGLLYHLELSAALELLRRCRGTKTIIDTHVALRPETKQGGYEGKVFEETLESPTASFGNQQSFWPTEDSLLKMLTDCGYSQIMKLVPGYRPDRTFWVCN